MFLVFCVTREPSDTTVVHLPVWRKEFVPKPKVTPTGVHTPSGKQQIYVCNSGEHIMFSKVNTKLLKVLQHLEVQSDTGEKFSLQVQAWSSHLCFDLLALLLFCELFLILVIHLKYREQLSNKENTAEFKMVLHATACMKALIKLLQFFV